MLEDKNMKEALSHLPERDKSGLSGIWREMLGQKSEEAILVKQIDALDYVVQLLTYSKQIKSDKRVREFFMTASMRVKDAELRHIYEAAKKRVFAERGMK